MLLKGWKLWSMARDHTLLVREVSLNRSLGMTLVGGSVKLWLKSSIMCLCTWASLTSCATMQAVFPRVDGHVEPTEWREARHYSTSSGLIVRIRKLNDLLFVGVSGSSAGYPTVFLGSAEGVEVLHASAALGNISYRHSVGEWRTSATEFTFDLRQGADGAQSPDSLRSVFFRQHGWLSTANRNHVKDREFVVKVRPDQRYVAVSFLAMPSRQVTTWPEPTMDEIRNPDILLGNVPATLRFNPSSWHHLR